MLETAEVPKAREAEGRFIANDMTAIAIAREIAAAFEGGRGPVSTDEICSRLDIPGEFGQKFLDELVLRGLLGRTSEPTRGYVLVRDPAHIRLSEIAEAMAGVALAQPNPDIHKDLHRIALDQRLVLARYNLNEILDMPPERAETETVAPRSGEVAGSFRELIGLPQRPQLFFAVTGILIVSRRAPSS